MRLSRLARLATSFIGGRGIRSTYRPKVGPLTLNTSAQTGLSSVSVGSGLTRWKVWDRRGNPGLSSVDLPGPISWRPTRGQKGRNQKSAPQASSTPPVSMNPNVGGSK